MFFRRGFILKSTEKALRSSKNGTRGYFQNSHPFERSAYFVVTITEYFECFQNKIENHFQKAGVIFFS